MQQLEQRLNQALQAQVPPKLCRRLRKRRVEVALDITDLPYHGQPEADEQEIRRSQAKSGTTHFHSYASLQIVHQRQRLTLALTWVTKGETRAQVVARLLEVARKLGLRLRCWSVDKAQVLEQLREIKHAVVDAEARQDQFLHEWRTPTRGAEPSGWRPSLNQAREFRFLGAGQFRRTSGWLTTGCAFDARNATQPHPFGERFRVDAQALRDLCGGLVVHHGEHRQQVFDA